LIASRPNGLHQYGLYNFKGERQNSVPERLAKDGLDDHGDGVLRAGFQCARCHTQKASSGLRDFGNDVKDLVEKGIEVLDPDPSVADALGGFYLSSKLARDLSRDREDYAAAVAEATGGLKPDESAKAVTDVLDYAVNLDVSPQDALRELGAKSLAGLRPSKSGVVLALYAGKPVKRTQFNAAFQDMLILVKLNAMP
jgi:mono/diheme cytochrome c family protein